MKMNEVQSTHYLAQEVTFQDKCSKLNNLIRECYGKVENVL